jgi:hypothetical protein
MSMAPVNQLVNAAAIRDDFVPKDDYFGEDFKSADQTAGTWKAAFSMFGACSATHLAKSPPLSGSSTLTRTTGSGAESLRRIF